MLARVPGDAMACDMPHYSNVPRQKGVHPIQLRLKRQCSQLRRQRKQMLAASPAANGVARLAGQISPVPAPERPAAHGGTGQK
jgi:hypothetical protein